MRPDGFQWNILATATRRKQGFISSGGFKQLKNAIFAVVVTAGRADFNVVNWIHTYNAIVTSEATQCCGAPARGRIINNW